MLQPRGGCDSARRSMPDRPPRAPAEDLDGHLAVLQVLAEIDRGHAPGAQLPLDMVAAGESGHQTGRRAGHFFTFSFNSSNQFSTSRNVDACVWDGR